MSLQHTDFLATLGKSLIENGYSIIPIPVGSKSPGFDGWQNTKSTPSALREWIANGHHDSGIGILTRNTPAVDLDIYDAEVVQLMEDWCDLNIGYAPVRVGRAPKRLLVFSCDEPFSKMKTGKYEDEWGDQHEIEILANGQQFVAYGLHKDTGLPYQWVKGTDPANQHMEELTTITVEDCKALMDYFVEVATERGWKKVTKSVTGMIKSSAEDDPFADVETVVEIPPDELRSRLMTIPGAEDHDLWVQVGMALFHQFSGDDDGLAMWHEWSETADNYDAEVLDRRWKSFEIEGKKRAPVTARTILKLAKEAATTLAVQTVLSLKDEFLNAKDEGEWRTACSKVRKAEIDALARTQLVEIARKRHFDLLQIKLPIPEARRLLAYELQNGKTPGWCHDWVFDASVDRFFHVKTKITMSMQGFNTVYARQSLTKKDILEGRTAPSATPADLAMNIYKIPEVYGAMYMPGKDIVFNYNGLRVANTYPESQVPEAPKEFKPSDKVAIRRIKDHIAHLLSEEREQRLFLNWLAWLVQNPGKRVNWAMVLQGVEGDGKSFFAFLLRTVMGASNVRMLNANVLEGDFTGWAHGQCVLVVEEPRLQGHNKYDVINKIKVFITNPVVSVHAKGRDPFDVENTTNYFMPTNFRDALPINSNDRRYCVLFSRWQSREALKEFMDENESYYRDLYGTLETAGPALRKWLLEHEIDDSFPAGGDAPVTTAHSYMVSASVPEAIRVVHEIIDEGEYPDINDQFVNATALPDAMIGRDTDLPQNQGLNRLLEHNGYVYMGRFRLEVGGTMQRLWSKNPETFKTDDGFDQKKIRDVLETYKAKREENEL